jgi:hypothetical protein
LAPATPKQADYISFRLGWRWFACNQEEEDTIEIETEEFITGEYYMEMSSMGMECTGYSPFQIEFLRPLKEKDYAKLEKKMQKELEKAREVLDGHREQIDEYLEETDGGKPFGGRNGQE